jgi:hypothetical protein
LRSNIVWKQAMLNDIAERYFKIIPHRALIACDTPLPAANAVRPRQFGAFANAQFK